MEMFRKGKVNIIPKRVRSLGQIKDIFRRTELKG